MASLTCLCPPFISHNLKIIDFVMNTEFYDPLGAVHVLCRLGLGRGVGPKTIYYILRYIDLTYRKILFSDALILASTNPQHDDRLFNELHVQYIILNVKTKQKKQFVYTTCSELVIFMY